MQSDSDMLQAMFNVSARAICTQARSAYPLSDTVVDALQCTGLSRDDAYAVAEAGGVDCTEARDADAAQLAKVSADRDKADRFWAQFPEHQAVGAAALPPSALCPARFDEQEARLGIGGVVRNNSQTQVNWGDRAYCLDGHVNIPGSASCKDCGQPLRTQAQRRRIEDQALPAQDVDLKRQRQIEEGTADT